MWTSLGEQIHGRSSAQGKMDEVRSIPRHCSRDGDCRLAWPYVAPVRSFLDLRDHAGRAMARVRFEARTSLTGLRERLRVLGGKPNRVCQSLCPVGCAIRISGDGVVRRIQSSGRTASGAAPARSNPES